MTESSLFSANGGAGMEPDGNGNGNWSLYSTRLHDVASTMASASQDNRDYDEELRALLMPAADTEQQP